MMTQNDYPRTAYTLSIIAGALMIASSIIVMIFSWLFLITQPVTYSYTPMRFGHFGGPFLAFGLMAIFGLISGIVVIVSGMMLKKSSDYTAWGILIIVFSIFSFFGMGGFVVGAILGIVSGALALSWKSS